MLSEESGEGVKKNSGRISAAESCNSNQAFPGNSAPVAWVADLEEIVGRGVAIIGELCVNLLTIVVW